MPNDWEDELATIDEDARKRFEKAIRHQIHVDIADFLPNKESKLYRPTLEELVLIDLEHRWKSRSSDETVKIEPYLERFPVIRDPKSLRRLVEEELRLRLQHGEKPSVVEYRDRFPILDLEDTFCQRATVDTMVMGDDGQERASLFSEIPGQSDEQRYSIEQEYAAGGMGIVYEAKDEVLGRKIVVKQLKGGLGNPAECRARFLNEAKLTSRLQHPGVVPVYDLGTGADGLPYYAMKMVEGETLRELIIRHFEGTGEESSLRRLINVLITVAKTVAYAHDQGVVHRDLKPANVVVGRYGETILLDWGLAKDRASKDFSSGKAVKNVSSADLTVTGSILGTPAYMSPEQAKGRTEQIDERSDIFGLGAILFHILTGETPATSLDELFDQVADKESPRARQKNASVPAPLDAICAKAMSHDREARYESAVDIAKDLELFLDDQSVTAYQDPFRVKIGRWARRHKAIVSSCIAALILLSIVGVVSGFVYQAAEADRSQRIVARRTSIEQSESNGLEEIYEGRFESGKKHFERALSLAGTDASFDDERIRIEDKLGDVERLLAFQRTSESGEDFGWNDQDEDAVLMLQRALAELKVFKQWDWWNHLTEFELSAQVEYQLQQQVYHDLCLLVAMRLHWGMMTYRNAIEFTMGTNQDAKRRFEAALIPIEAAERFRPAVGLDFAKALCGSAAGGLTGWTRFLNSPDVGPERLTDPRELKNPVDKYFIGMALLYYHLFDVEGGDPIVNLVRLFLKFDEPPLEAALTMLREASAQRPDHFYTVIAYSWAAEAAGDYDRALVALSRCIVIQPDSYYAYNERALQYILLGQAANDQDVAREYFRRALDDVEKAISLAPNDGYVHLRKGIAISHFPDNFGAVAEAQIKAMTLVAPTEESLQFTIHRQSRANTIAPVLEYAKQLMAHDAEMAEAWVLAMLCAWRLEDAELAEEYMNEALRLWPEAPVALIVRGEMSLRDGRFDDARRDFEEVVRLDDSQFLAHRGLALIELEQEKSDKAVATYSSLIKLAGNDWQTFEAYTGRAIASIKVGAFDQALADVQQILTHRPSSKCSRVLEAANDEEDIEFLERLNELLENRSPEPTRPSLEEPGDAALMNGGFELPLSVFWNTSESHPSVWWNEGGCRADAERTSQASAEGEYCLRVRNLSPRADGVHGKMYQEVPTEPGHRYRIQFQAKTIDLGERGFAIRYFVGGEPTALVELQDGDTDWTNYDAEFLATSKTTRIELVSSDIGTVWIDELRLGKVVEGSE